jgi:hypothetical protein
MGLTTFGVPESGGLPGTYGPLVHSASIIRDLAMRQRFLAILAAVGLIVTFTAAAASAGPIRIDKVQYDSPGSDGGSNSSLNAEWVVIKNAGKKPRQLKGWKLRDSAGYVYTFGTLKLRPGRSVTVHTGKGSNSGKHRYWRQDWYVWNNDGDKATLRNKGGQQVDTCSWGDGSGTTGC